jgi:hypothetical protein
MGGHGDERSGGEGANANFQKGDWDLDDILGAGAFAVRNQPLGQYHRVIDDDFCGC